MIFILLSLFAFSSAHALESNAKIPANQMDLSYIDTENALPSRAKRVQALEQAGLAEVASQMDELDQDLLYYRAKNKSKKELLSLYPQLSKEKLGKFQSFIQEKK